MHIVVTYWVRIHRIMIIQPAVAEEIYFASFKAEEERSLPQLLE